MKKHTVYDVLEEVIFKISSRFNQKALREVIQCELTNSRHVDYNDILRKYYERVHRLSPRTMFLGYMNIEGEDDLQVARDEGAVAYKQLYDYKNGGKIKQKNTGLLVLYTNGWRTFCHWVFDVYRYIDAMGYQVPFYNLAVH